MTPLTEEHIWEVLDGEASPEMIIQHEAQLLVDESYRTALVQCVQLHQQLLALPLEAPSMRFSENLMERLTPERQIAPKKDRLPLVFVTIFSILSGLLATLIFSTDSLIPSTGARWTTDTAVKLLSNPLFIQTFIILNIVLLFAVLDRKVLKPYFDSRAKRDVGVSK